MSKPKKDKFYLVQEDIFTRGYKKDDKSKRNSKTR